MANNIDNSGSIPLGAVAARAEWLVVACRKCDRKGRLRLATLLGRAADPIRLQQAPLMEQIMTAQPATMAGHRARARTLAYWAPDLLEPGQTETGDDPERLLAIIIIDLLDGQLPVTRKGNKLVVTNPAVVGVGDVS